MKKFLIAPLLLGFFAGFLLFTGVVHFSQAQSITDSSTKNPQTITDAPTKDPNTIVNGQFSLHNPIGGANGTVRTFLDNILNGIVVLLTPVLVIMLLYCGFLFVAGQGNTEKLGEAKKMLMYTLLGAAIVLASSGLAHLIQNTVTGIAG